MNNYVGKFFVWNVFFYYYIESFDNKKSLFNIWEVRPNSFRTINQYELTPQNNIHIINYDDFIWSDTWNQDAVLDFVNNSMINSMVLI